MAQTHHRKHYYRVVMYLHFVLYFSYNSNFIIRQLQLIIFSSCSQKKISDFYFKSLNMGKKASLTKVQRTRIVVLH